MKRRKTGALKVGRAGHDPATYGLKGPLSSDTPSLETRPPVESPASHVPPVNHVRAGGPVVVTAGLAAGLRGIALERAKVTFGDVPVWAVRFDLPLGVRCIRADYLAAVA